MIKFGDMPNFVGALADPEILKVGLGLGVGALGALTVARAGEAALYEFHDKKQQKNSTLLKIMPKKSVDIKETEKLIKNLHSMLLNTKWRKLQYGRPYMSFEIASNDGKVNFYVSVPNDMKTRIVDRIYATYSDISIEAVEDYIPTMEKVPCYATEVVLGLHHTLKIKTKANEDILPSIVSGMKDLDKGAFNAVQVIVRPIDNKWQIKGYKDLRKFEMNGVRLGEEKGFSDKLMGALNEGVSELTRGSGKGNINIFGVETSNKKTKKERKEITAATDKLSEPGFETVIRIISIGHYKKDNTARVKALSAAFNELDAENKFKKDLTLSHLYIKEKFKNRKAYLYGKNNILIPSELANFFLRLPGKELLEKYQEIERLAVKEFQAPAGAESSGRGVIFAKNTYRGKDTILEYKDKDLVRHVVVQGKTGSGKSEFFKTTFVDHISDKYDDNGKLIRKGRGAMVLEPHGKLADELLQLIPENRRKDTIVFDLFSDYPYGLNFCSIPDRDSEDISKDVLRQKTISEAIELIKMRFSDVWSEKNEFYITNSIKAIMETDQTMVELPRMLSDKAFRDKIIPQIQTLKVKKFWEDKFKENKNGGIDPAVLSTAQSVEYKFEKFLDSDELGRSLGQKECIDFKDILDNDKIIIFKFDKKRLSKDRINFLGSVAIKLVTVAAYSRDISKWDIPFLIGLDETQNFLSPSIKDILWELRKYGIVLFMMHQELGQMREVPGLLEAIYDNVGTSITFQCGEFDGSFFASRYGSGLDKDDIENLPSRHGYCKLLVNGHTSSTFNIYSIDSPRVTAEVGEQSVKEILAYNHKGRMHKDDIDKMIASRFEDEESIYDNTPSSFSIDAIEKSYIEDNEKVETSNNKKSRWD